MAYLFWTIALVLFSSLEVVSKPIMGQVDPFTMTMLQLSIKHSNASSAATLISTSPKFTAIFAYLIISEKIIKRKKIGILLGLVRLINQFINEAF